MAEKRMSMPLSDFALLYGVVEKHGSRLKMDGTPWKSQSAQARLNESAGATGKTWGTGARARQAQLRAMGLSDWGTVPKTIQSRMAKGYVTGGDLKRLKGLGISMNRVKSVFGHKVQGGINPKTGQPYYRWTTADHISASQKMEAHYASPEGARLRAIDSANGKMATGKTWKNPSMARLRKEMLVDARLTPSVSPLVAEYAEKAYLRGFNKGKKVNSSPLNLNLKV